MGNTEMKNNEVIDVKCEDESCHRGSYVDVVKIKWEQTI